LQSHLEAGFLNNDDQKIIVIEQLLGIVHFTANAHINKTYTADTHRVQLLLYVDCCRFINRLY